MGVWSTSYSVPLIKGLSYGCLTESACTLTLASLRARSSPMAPPALRAACQGFLPRSRAAGPTAGRGLPFPRLSPCSERHRLRTAIVCRPCGQRVPILRTSGVQAVRRCGNLGLLPGTALSTAGGEELSLPRSVGTTRSRRMENVHQGTSSNLPNGTATWEMCVQASTGRERGRGSG